jgi:hypothetical protein
MEQTSGNQYFLILSTLQIAGVLGLPREAWKLFSIYVNSVQILIDWRLKFLFKSKLKYTILTNY